MRESIEESKTSKHPHPPASATGPCPTIITIQIVGRPGTGSFTQPSRTHGSPSKCFLRQRNCSKLYEIA